MSRKRTISDEQILSTARGFFREHGLQTSTRKLALEIGISEAVLFQRFRSKENLIVAAFQPPIFNANRIVEAAGSGKDAKETLQKKAIAIFAELRRLLPFYFPQFAHPEFDPEHAFHSRKSPFQSFLDALESHLKSERQAGQIRTESTHTTAYFIVSALHNAALLEMVAGPSTDVHEGMVLDLIGIVWQGLDPRS